MKLILILCRQKRKQKYKYIFLSLVKIELQSLTKTCLSVALFHCVMSSGHCLFTPSHVIVEIAGHVKIWIVSGPTKAKVQGLKAVLCVIFILYNFDSFIELLTHFSWYKTKYWAVWYFLCMLYAIPEQILCFYEEEKWKQRGNSRSRMTV